jgi:hypothetical protein
VIRRERVDAVAEPARRHREHPAQLAAAEHTDGGTWRDHCGLWIADCGLDCGMAVSDRGSHPKSIRNPQSAIRNVTAFDA